MNWKKMKYLWFEIEKRRGVESDSSICAASIQQNTSVVLVHAAAAAAASAGCRCRSRIKSENRSMKNGIPLFDLVLSLSLRWNNGACIAAAAAFPAFGPKKVQLQLTPLATATATTTTTVLQ